MNRTYWHQRASTWVSISVLAGGLVVACLTVFIYRVENNLKMTSLSYEDEFAQLEESNLGITEQE